MELELPKTPINQWTIIRNDMDDRNENATSQIRSYAKAAHFISSLHSCIKQEVHNAKLKATINALDYYCLVQIEATIKYMDELAQEDCLNHKIVYVLMGNLGALHRKMLTKSPDASLGLAKRLIAFSDNLTEITQEFEQTDGHRMDWQNWADNMVLASQRVGGQWPGKFADGKYVPRLNDFAHMVTLGCDPPTVVFRAVYAPTGSECVLKVHKYKNHNHALRLTTTNVLTAVAINCPFLIRYLACFPVTGGYVALHEYYKAYDYEDIVQLVGSFDLDSTVKIAAQLILAVEHLHLVGLIHRDLKQKNVLMAQNGRIKVIDYDLNRPSMGHHYKKCFRLYFRRTPWEFERDEETGWIVYKPPELFSHGIYGRAYDWWAVGCNVYKTYFGRLPFRGKSRNHFMANVVQQPTPWPNETPYGPPDLYMQSFLSGLLHKDPEQRLGSNSYADLKTHMLFENLDFETFWKMPNIIRNSYIDECIGKIENKLAARDVAEQKSYFGRKLDAGAPQGMKFLEHIKDRTVHQPMYTFVSQSLKNVHAAISEHEFYSRDSFLEADPELVDIDYSQEVKPEDAFEVESNPQKKAAMMGDSIKIVLEKPETQDNFGIGVDLWNDKSDIFWIVTDVLQDSPAAQGDLIIGDVIVTVNGKSITQKTLQSLEAINYVEFIVMAFNPFRLLRSRRDIMTFVQKSRKLNVELAMNDLPNSGLTVVERQVWDMERQIFVFIHLILRIDSRIETDASIYPGDIITKINQYDVRGLPILAVNGHLSSAEDGPLRIKIAPLSVLRKSIKQETTL